MKIEPRRGRRPGEGVGADTGAGNLAPQLTSFVGREQDILEIKGLVSDRCLLTLTGPGGCGKTRLALAVSFEVVEAFDDGVWWVELSSITEPDMVPRAAAWVLGIPERHGIPRIEMLAEHLRTRKTLLVLDNCEHLVEACAQLADALLQACPGVRVLATSREILGVPGEVSWPVPPLSLPEVPDLSVGQLRRYEAVRLFVERARASSSSFDLTEQNASAVARLCRGLEGMPLAIELAAARTRVLSPGQIADRLDESLRLLKSGARTSSPRQQTLRATMDWSFGLLSEEEKLLFGRLSVFVDGFTLAAAEEVCGGEGVDQDDVANVLFRLVDKSLVVVDRREEGEQTRFRLLETIREYALERLKESGEADVFRHRHAAHFLRMAERAAPELFGPEQAHWLGSLETEHDNLRAALGWALGGGSEAETGLRLAEALGEFWYMRGHLGEGRRWLDRGLQRGDVIPPSLRARALEKAGWIAIFQDDGDAIALLEESLGLFQDLGDAQGSALALAGLGWALLFLRGDEGRLAALREEAERMRREPLDRWTLSHLLTFLSLEALVEGSYDRAVALSEESMGLSRELGDTLGLAICTHTLGMAASGQGDHERASALFKENLRVLWEQGDRVNVGHCLLGLGGVALSQGQPERAALLWGAAESLREATGSTLTPLVRSHYAYEARLADARSRMGVDAFANTWNEARTMTLQQAVEYALEREDQDAGSPAARPLPAGLSQREAEVLALAAQGLTSVQIGEKLFISPRTVNRHLDSVYKKLGVNSRVAAARFASEHGIG